MHSLFKKSLAGILSFLPYIYVFIASLYLPTDPDLGWHLKYGEYFFQHHSLLRDNTFSTMMPDYHWANTSWITDIISYAVYHFAGFLGISLVGALVVTLTLYFFSKAANLTLWSQTILFPFLIYFETPVNNVSFRGQLLTYLLLGILFYLIRSYNKHPKALLITIPLFILWSNLNGEYLFGIVMFAAWIFFYILQGIYLAATTSNPYKKQTLNARINNLLAYNRKEIFKLIFIFLLAFFATFINPFGAGPFEAALSHIGSPLLKDIVEFLPITLFSTLWWQQIVIISIIGIVILIVLLHEQLIPPLYFVIFALFLYSFEVQRYIWPVYYMVIPILRIIAGLFTPYVKWLKAISFIIFSGLLIITFMSKQPMKQYLSYSWNDYCFETGCSPRSAQFLVRNKITHNLFSLYGWGGWLIWNYPQIKPLIDGRMHLWRDDKGYSGFADYYDYEHNKKDIDSSKYDVVYIAPIYPIVSRLYELENEGKWSLVYQDQYAVIFVRNKSQSLSSRTKPKSPT